VRPAVHAAGHPSRQVSGDSSGRDPVAGPGVRAAGRWTISIYGLPALDPRETYPVPAPADVDPHASMTAVSDDDRVVVLLDGLLSAWDRPSRQQIGEPATIGEGPDEQRALRRGHAWLRPGRPD
jgi:hypothetical protein